MTTINNIWGEDTKGGPYTTYSSAIQDHLTTVASHEWTHLVDSDPNPADARAAVGADIAALGPG
jgi:ribonuclease HI